MALIPKIPKIPKEELLRLHKERILYHKENISKFMNLFLKVSEYLGWKTLILATLFMILSVYFLSSPLIQAYKTALFVIFIYILYLILQTSAFVYESIKLLLDNGTKSITKLLSAYFVSIIGIIMLFALFYNISSTMGSGYLTYSQCHDDFSRDVMLTDENIVTSNLGYVYFSAITFFSVGYGDICPMGAAKLISILNTWLGHAYTVIVLGLAVAIYTKDKTEKE